MAYNTRPDSLLYDIEDEVDKVLQLLGIEHDWSEEAQEDKILDAIIDQVDAEDIDAEAIPEITPELQVVMEQLAKNDRAYTWYSNAKFEQVYPKLQEMESTLPIWQIHSFPNAKLVEFGDQATNDDLILPREQLRYLIELTEQEKPFSFIKKDQREQRLKELRSVVDIEDVVEFGNDDLLVIWALPEGGKSSAPGHGLNYGMISCGKNIQIITQPIYMGDNGEEDPTGLLASLVKIVRLKQDEIDMYYKKVEKANDEVYKISKIITTTASMKEREEALVEKLKARIATGLSNLENLENMHAMGKRTAHNEYVKFADQLGTLMKRVAKRTNDHRALITDQTAKLRHSVEKKTKLQTNIGAINKKLKNLEEEERRDASSLEQLKRQNHDLRQKYEELSGRSADLLYKNLRKKEAAPNPMAEFSLPHDDVSARDADYYQSKLKKYRRHSQVHRGSIASMMK